MTILVGLINMYRLSKDVLEKRYRKVRKERDVLKSDLKWWKKECEISSNELNKVKKELLEYKLLLHEQMMKNKER